MSAPHSSHVRPSACLFIFYNYCLTSVSLVASVGAPLGPSVRTTRTPWISRRITRSETVDVKICRQRQSGNQIGNPEHTRKLTTSRFNPLDMSDPWDEPGVVETYSGGGFDLFSPTPEDVRLRDIAAGLAHTCRFGGHCREFYSVAHHSLHVSTELPDDRPRLQLIGLLQRVS